jgi:hypothetical protein
MMAETPQIDEPMASREVSFGVSPKARPSAVMNSSDTEISMEIFAAQK